MDDQASARGDYVDAVGGLGYWEGVQILFENFWAGFSLRSEFTTIVVMGVPMFLLGARLYRAGVFEASGRLLRRRLMVVGLLVALPVEILLGVGVLELAVQPSALLRHGTAPAVAFGILALVAEVYQRRPVGWLGRRLAAVGATALSCYLLQNILGVIFAHTVAQAVALSPYGAYVATVALFVGLCALMIVFSSLWLRRFDRGPFELVWHWSHDVVVDGARWLKRLVRRG